MEYKSEQGNCCETCCPHMLADTLPRGGRDLRCGAAGLCNLSEEMITALMKRCHPSSARKCEQVLMFDPVL